jgi:hypothetical protein
MEKTGTIWSTLVGGKSSLLYIFLFFGAVIFVVDVAIFVVDVIFVVVHVFLVV